MKTTKPAQERPCEGWHLSQCCGASIVHGDTCKCCNKKCTNMCINCEDAEFCGEKI